MKRKKMMQSETGKLLVELIEDYMFAFYARCEEKKWEPDARVEKNLKLAAETILAQQEVITALTRELYGKEEE